MTDLHILVVDDDDEIQKLLGRYLQTQGYRVTTAASGRDLLDRLKSRADQRPDLVVRDGMLPDGSGVDL